MQKCTSAQARGRACRPGRGINMTLNSYKEEARDFLEKINALNEPPERKIKFLEEEFKLLKGYVETDEVDKIRHQVYDMLFLLFGLSAAYELDLDGEWRAGKEHKQKKYLSRQE